MNHAAIVRVREGVSDLLAVLDDFSAGKSFRRNDGAQRLAGDVLHRQVRPALELGRLEERADVRVVQRRGRARFAQDPVGGPAGRRLLDDLQGDESIEPGVARPVDAPHPTRADLLQHLVLGQSRVPSSRDLGSPCRSTANASRKARAAPAKVKPRGTGARHRVPRGAIPLRTATRSAATGAVEKRFALVAVELDGLEEQGLDGAPVSRRRAAHAPAHRRWRGAATRGPCSIRA